MAPAALASGADEPPELGVCEVSASIGGIHCCLSSDFPHYASRRPPCPTFGDRLIVGLHDPDFQHNTLIAESQQSGIAHEPWAGGAQLGLRRKHSSDLPRAGATPKSQAADAAHYPFANFVRNSSGIHLVDLTRKLVEDSPFRLGGEA